MSSGVAPKATASRLSPLILTILALVFAAPPTLLITPFALLPAGACREAIQEGTSVTRCTYSYTLQNAEVLLLPISFILLVTRLLYCWKCWPIARRSLLAGATLCIVIAVGGTATGGAYFIYFGFLELAAGLTAGLAALRRT